MKTNDSIAYSADDSAWILEAYLYGTVLSARALRVEYEREMSL